MEMVKPISYIVDFLRAFKVALFIGLKNFQYKHTDDKVFGRNAIKKRLKCF